MKKKFNLEKKMHNYPSDISREQFEIIRPELEGAKRKTKPRKYDLYDIFCAILYILRGGVQWRMLPSNFPSWKLVEIERRSIGRNDKTSFDIIDSKSIKNVDTAEQKGYDAGKKVSGIKIHIIVDILGLPHAIYVTCANVTDRNGALEMISLHLDNLSCVKNFLVDSGYSGVNFSNSVREIHGATVEVVKKSDLPKFSVIPKMTVLALLALLIRRF